MLKFIGNTFPTTWIWSTYETNIIQRVSNQIEQVFPSDRNLFINLTWFGPQFTPGSWNEYLTIKHEQWDNLFLLCTVDPAMIPPPIINQMVTELGNPRLFKIGNFDTEYHFNFFAPVLANHFHRYTPQEIRLVNPKYIYINYNRKPREHRVTFMRLLKDSDLLKYGVNTLGKPNIIYDKDPNNDLYFTIGENPQDYVESGHWYGAGPDEFEIPHDVLSLHRMDLWQEHFLYIIGATEFNPWDDIFVSETQFKPIIGMRPFLINGNPRTYQWLRDNGFKTFDKWFPGIDFDDQDNVHVNLIAAIQQLVNKSPKELTEMYQDMLPTLEHNRQRFWNYAEEQQKLVDCILLNEYNS